MYEKIKKTLLSEKCIGINTEFGFLTRQILSKMLNVDCDLICEQPMSIRVEWLDEIFETDCEVLIFSKPIPEMKPYIEKTDKLVILRGDSLGYTTINFEFTRNEYEEYCKICNITEYEESLDLVLKLNKISKRVISPYSMENFMEVANVLGKHDGFIVTLYRQFQLPKQAVNLL